MSPRLDRAGDAHFVHRGCIRIGDPERQLHPLPDLVLLQQLGRDPLQGRVAAADRAAGLEHVAPAAAGVRGVVDAGCPPLGQVDQPRAEIPGIDELHLILGWRRRDDLSTAGDPVRPVGEASGGVVGADDQPRPNARLPLGEDLGDRLLAERLQRPVVRVVVGQLVVGEVSELGHRAVLVDRLGEARVHRDARDEQVVAGRVGQRLGRGADHRGDVAGGIQHGVPLATFQRAEVGRPVAAQLLRFGEQLGIRLAAVEERHLVPARERRLDRSAPEEPRPAENEQPHAVTGGASRRSRWRAM